MGEKQKGRGTAVPSVDSSRFAKLHIDSSSDEGNLQKLIKKVIETTRCSASQAEVALFDNDNDVQRAVLYILDRNGQVECWTEQKSRKAKKDEVEKEEVIRRSLESSPSKRGSRGSSAPRPPRGTGVAPRGGSVGRVIGRGGSVRGGRGRVTSSSTTHNTVSNSTLAEVESILPVASQYEEIDWKNGPLVYEPSSASVNVSQPVVSSVAATAAGPISFAAMAKKATAPPSQSPALPVPAESVSPKLPEPVDEEEEEIVEEETVDVSLDKIAEQSPRIRTPEPINDEIEENEVVGQAWTTEQLKAELGIGIVKEETPQTLRERVEFVERSGNVTLSEYHFGFCAPDPEPVMVAPTVSVPSPQMSFNRNIVHPPVSEPSPPQDESSVLKNVQPSFSRGLSYETTSSMAYPPSEARSMIPPRAQQSISQQPPQPQQAQQQQQAHSSMFPPQMPPYGNYPYMNMYSPVAGGMRGDDPYTAALMQYPFGMGQIDLSNILPQSALSSQNGLPPRTEHSDMNKYGGGGGRSDNVAPPPGFASSAQFMAQPSLSSLLVQPQYGNHPFSAFMMPSVNNSNSRYDEDRRGKDTRSSHHAHNTPPPHMGYSHHQQSNSGGAYGSGSHKKSQYPSSNWNNN